jgi:hypothetical protein
MLRCKDWDKGSEAHAGARYVIVHCGAPGSILAFNNPLGLLEHYVVHLEINQRRGQRDRASHRGILAHPRGGQGSNRSRLPI